MAQIIEFPIKSARDFKPKDSGLAFGTCECGNGSFAALVDEKSEIMIGLVCIKCEAQVDLD